MHPVLLRVGALHIPTYTVCMLSAVLVVGWLSYREAKRRRRLTDSTLLVGAMGLLGGVLGAKLSMVVFLGPTEFWRQLSTLPFHGQALTGGLIGAYVAVVLAERGLGVDRCTGDLVAPFLPLGMALVRLGNFLAADAYGTPTSLPWGVYQAGAYRHPAALYELVLDLALFAFLWHRRRVAFRDGELFRIYVVAYALIRFPIEFVRYQPTPRGMLGLTLVQWLCIAAVIGFGYQLYLHRKGVDCVCDLLPRPGKRKSLAMRGRT
jgi:phosphatidylglycerol:prolipoprotein diacylglycerol transferase